jgi:hypothetical protein
VISTGTTRNVPGSATREAYRRSQRGKSPSRPRLDRLHDRVQVVGSSRVEDLGLWAMAELAATAIRTRWRCRDWLRRTHGQGEIYARSQGWRGRGPREKSRRTSFFALEIKGSVVTLDPSTSPEKGSCYRLGTMQGPKRRNSWFWCTETIGTLWIEDEFSRGVTNWSHQAN